MPQTDTALANISLNSEWLNIPIFDEDGLQLAFDLLIDLRGKPEHWTAAPEGMILIREHTSKFDPESRGFHPFLGTQTASSLAAACWSQLIPLNELIVSDGDPWLTMRIPRQPNMGGPGGWSQLQLLFWQCSPYCIIETGEAIRQAR